MKKADLHIHTTASDGRLSPLGVVRQAKQSGLSYIAITDHDTVDGLLLLQKEQSFTDEKLTIISGIEFSTDTPEHEIHILGYGIALDNPNLLEQLTALKRDRIDRVYRMVDKLRSLGYPVDVQRILSFAKDAASVGRPHVARVLVQCGYFATVAEAFDRLLNKDKPGYVPHYKLSVRDVIGIIRQAGGVPILAHPGLVGDDDLVEQVIEEGIAGIEVYHPTHDDVVVKKYLQLARRHDLLITGGSDFHAISGRYPESLGLFYVDGELAETLCGKFGHTSDGC